MRRKKLPKIKPVDTIKIKVGDLGVVKFEKYWTYGGVKLEGKKSIKVLDEEGTSTVTLRLMVCDDYDDVLNIDVSYRVDISERSIPYSKRNLVEKRKDEIEKQFKSSIPQEVVDKLIEDVKRKTRKQLDKYIEEEEETIRESKKNIKKYEDDIKKLDKVLQRGINKG